VTINSQVKKVFHQYGLKAFILKEKSLTKIKEALGKIVKSFHPILNKHHTSHMSTDFDGGLPVFFITSPETLLLQNIKQFPSTLNVDQIVADEAHTITEW